MDSEQRTRGSEIFEEVMGFPAPRIEEPFFDATREHSCPHDWGRGWL